MFLFVPCFPSGAVVLLFLFNFFLLSREVGWARPACPHHHHLTHIPFASHLCMCLYLICFNLLCSCSPFTDFDSLHQPKFTHQLHLQTLLFPSCIPIPLTSPHPPLLLPTAFTPLFLFLLSWSEALLSPHWYDASGIMVSFAPFPAGITMYMCQILLNVKQAGYCVRRPLFGKPRKKIVFCCCQKMLNFQPAPGARWEEPCCVLTVISYIKQCFIDSGIVWFSRKQ